MKNNFLLLLLAGLGLMTACTDSTSSFDASEVCPESGRGTFQDVRDGQVYKYITIGDRVWMDQNLNYPAETSTCYDEQQSNCDIRDGQVYKYITIGDRVWMDQNLNYPAETSTCYDEQQSNCDIYGRLYSVQYMNTKQNNYGTFNPDIIDSICPNGWRVPTLAEWNEIVDQMDGLKHFKNSECMDVSLFGGMAYVKENPSTGEPIGYIFHDLGRYRQWITSTYDLYGSMKLFDVDLTNKEEKNTISTSNGYYSLRCIKKAMSTQSVANNEIMRKS